MYFPKQHYESIVPEKSGFDRFSASHDNDLFYLIHSSKPALCTMKLPSHNTANLPTSGRNSFEQKVIVPGAGHYRFIVPALLTNEFPRIYHVMHKCI